MFADNWAMLLKARGTLADTEPFDRRPFEASGSALDGGHPKTLVFVNNWAMLVKASRELADTALLLRQALVVPDCALGKGNRARSCS